MNPKQLEYDRRYRAKHPDRHRAMRKKYRDENPEYERRRAATRAAREKAAGPDLTKEDRTALLKASRGRCTYCGGKCDPVVFDHRIPLCRGGMNEMSNRAVCCVPCNRKKSTRTDVEFLRILAFYP